MSYCCAGEVIVTVGGVFFFAFGAVMCRDYSQEKHSKYANSTRWGV